MRTRDRDRRISEQLEGTLYALVLSVLLIGFLFGLSIAASLGWRP